MIDRWCVGVWFGVALLTGCGDPTAPEERLVTHVALDRTTLAPGDTLRATVTVTNMSLFAVTIYGSSSCLVGMAIYRDATGELAYPRGQGCTTDLVPLRFGPGQSHSRTFRWTAERYEYVSPELRKYQDPPGRYRVVGGLGWAIDLKRPSAPASIEVVTP